MKILLLFLLIACAIIIGYVIYRISMAFRSTKWPSVFGRITIYKVEESFNPEGPNVFTPKIEYTYTVDTKMFSSKKISYKIIRLFSAKKANAIINDTKDGENVKVYYNPKNPHQSVLINKMGWKWESFLLLLLLFFEFVFIINLSLY